MKEKIRQANTTFHRYLFTATTFSKILAMILFIVLPFVGLYLGMRYQQQLGLSATTPTQVTYLQIHNALLFQPIPSSVVTASTSFSTPSGEITVDTSGNWKTFTNTQLGFSVTFPSRGIESTWTKEGTVETEIECGKRLFNVVSHKQGVSGIRLDSFFDIWVENSTQIINDMLNSANDDLKQYHLTVNDIYDITHIVGSGADEAILFIRKPKLQLPVGDDGIPYSYTIAIYKKGGKIFSLGRGQQSVEGCNRPLDGVNWDIPNSFKIL